MNLLWKTLTWLLIQTPVCIAVCTSVSTWQSFVNAVEEAEDYISFCSFAIAKPLGSRLLIRKSIHLSCFQPRECFLSGEGNHIRIQGSTVNVLIEGFTFQGASESAIRIAPSVERPQVVRDCDFIGNHGSLDSWRGGAIKTEEGTTLTILSCNFVDNRAARGGAIYHRGETLTVIESVFQGNSAKHGGAIGGSQSSHIELSGSSFIANQASLSPSGAIAVEDADDVAVDSTVTWTDNSCNGVYDVTADHCLGSNPTDTSFVPGDLSTEMHGIKLSRGLTATLLAETGQAVEYSSPEAAGFPHCELPFHGEPDGAAVFELDDGGWLYISNSEVPDGEGGVYALEFDSSGLIRKYEPRLVGTSRNCNGGATPWNTWVSCEEFGQGQCWQVDPRGQRRASQTALGGLEGGNFEAFCYDVRDPDDPQFFVTEDHARGALRRFRPGREDLTLSWNMLQRRGRIDYLEILPNNRFRWTNSLSAGRQSAEDHFQNAEGIINDNGVLLFVAKKDKLLFRLDLDNLTYTVARTDQLAIVGDGSFRDGPDQLLKHHGVFFFTEDGGRSPGVYMQDGTDFYTILEATAARYRGDETTGLAFSPDGTKLYVCFQEIGHLFQIERLDGEPFQGTPSQRRHVLGWNREDTAER